MRTDGQTDMTRLVVPFRNFAKVLKNIKKLVTQSNQWALLMPTNQYQNLQFMSFNSLLCSPDTEESGL